MKIFATAAAIAALSLTAIATPAHSQDLLGSLLNALKGKKAQSAHNGSAAAQTGGQLTATMTPQQGAALDTLLAEPVADPAIAAARADAMPLITQLVKIGACAQSGEAWNRVNRFYITPMVHYSWLKTPMYSMRYHDKGACLDTTRISDWSMPAKNALKFRSAYVAEDSGESGLLWFQLQKLSNGSWMIRSIGEG